MMATPQAPQRSEYSDLFTRGLYAADPASRRPVQPVASSSSSFLDVDDPSESGDDTDASMSSFVGSLRPTSQAARAVSPTPTVRPHGVPSRPPHTRHANIPPPAPAPSHALPSLPPSAYSSPPYGTPPPPARGAPIPGHARTPTAASYGASPTDARTAALARLEGRPSPAQQHPQYRPHPSQLNGYGEVPQGSSFLSLGDPPQGRSRPSPPRRG